MSKLSAKKVSVSSEADTFPWVTLSFIFLAMLPVTMIVPVYKEIIKDRLGGTGYGVAWFQSSAMLGSFLFSPIAGWISDKLGTRRKLIGIFALVDAVLLALLPFMPNISSLFVLRFLEGGAHIFVIGLLLTCISDKEKDKTSNFYNRGILFGLGGTLLTLGGGVGQALGFLGNKNPLLPFFVGAAILSLLGILSFFLLEEGNLKKLEWEGWKKTKTALALSPLLIVPILFHFIDRFTVGYFLSSLNLHLREDLGFTPGQVGGLFGVMFLLMSILSLPAALLSKKWNSISLVWIGSFIYGIAQASTGFLNNSSNLYLSMIACGIGAGIMYVPAMRLASSLAPNGFNAVVMTVFTGLGSLGFLLGPLVSVSVQDTFTSLYNQSAGLEFTGILYGGLEVLLVLGTLPLLSKILAKEKNI
ncbi:MFS transporter [Leptospira sarikeiensis]|uniref:MFS transporter n=1 Tax=Leptospira sarikeiensis TaxID=2484943 RepID=A0A4R9KA93_9LEPT|nr:MFS transporter [Leptospira sarikeiensis]TGL61704.1 MFS transporter [Leptospira sarikeiensis]